VLFAPSAMIGAPGAIVFGRLADRLPTGGRSSTLPSPS
jgi:hypothetical protein